MGTSRSDLIPVKSTLLFDWKPVYSGNLPWVPSRTIYLTRHGSHAYGTNLPTSDLDLRGVMIAPREYYLGFLNTVEQVTQSEPDLTVFELRKFMKLAAGAYSLTNATSAVGTFAQTTAGAASADTQHRTYVTPPIRVKPGVRESNKEGRFWHRGPTQKCKYKLNLVRSSP